MVLNTGQLCMTVSIKRMILQVFYRLDRLRKPWLPFLAASDAGRDLRPNKTLPAVATLRRTLTADVPLSDLDWR